MNKDENNPEKLTLITGENVKMSLKDGKVNNGSKLILIVTKMSLKMVKYKSSPTQKLSSGLNALMYQV